ncbi:hypothetical protein QL093DRAFT_2550410, partial [Fusarium oxysporum]
QVQFILAGKCRVVIGSFFLSFCSPDRPHDGQIFYWGKKCSRINVGTDRSFCAPTSRRVIAMQSETFLHHMPSIIIQID